MQNRRDAFEEYILDSRDEADDALDSMCEILDHEGFVTIGDYYDVIGVKQRGYTDYDFGWDDLSRANPRKKGTGYILGLGRPIHK